MSKLYFIKIGGSAITETNVPNSAKRDEIKRILSEVMEAKASTKARFVIGHGSGSFGHIPAKEYRVNEGIIDKRSRIGATITKSAANSLNAIVIDVAASMDIPAFPFAASSFGISKEKRIASGFTRSIAAALRKGMIPVVYGDVMIDLKQGVSIASTEEIFRFLSYKLKPDAIILGTDVSGVYDKDPTNNPDAKRIGVVNSSNIDSVTGIAGGAHKIDVTGGMKTKISTLYEAVKISGGTGYIANIKTPGIIKKIVEGEPGSYTEVKP
jgi:isopentenyl phosphate kinase